MLKFFEKFKCYGDINGKYKIVFEKVLNELKLG